MAKLVQGTWTYSSVLKRLSKLQANPSLVCLYSAIPKTELSNQGWRKGGPTWRRWLMLGLGTLVTVPLSVLGYRYYRIYSQGAEIAYDPALPKLVHLFMPPIIYKGMNMMSLLLERVIQLKSFEVRQDDIYIVGFPRSGTSWTCELVYLIAHDADTDLAKSDVLSNRVQLLENWGNTEAYDLQPSPRCYMSHLQYHLLPKQVETKQPKIVYVMRNPKDVVVSQYFMGQKFFLGPGKDFNRYIDSFIDKRTANFGPWDGHVKQFWKRREQENILFLKYEDMVTDLDGAVRKIASFLGKTFTEEQICTVVRHCSFSAMKQNDKSNMSWLNDTGLFKDLGNDFLRKGKVGDWTNHLSAEQSARIEKMVEESLRGTGLTVEYE